MKLYQIKIGFAPGDWEFDSEHETRAAAVTRRDELAGKIFIGRYKFALPVRIKLVHHSVALRRQVSAAVIAPPILRKRAEAV